MSRVYSARMIEAGLYLQPSNDGQRFFAIARYQDGRARGLTEGPWLATYWSWGEIPKERLAHIEAVSAHDPEAALEKLREFSNAGVGGSMLPTKRAAIEEALAR